MTDDIALSAVQQKFIKHWGEMGTRWGVNRTVAQVHALLYISPLPLNADDIVAALDVARSNVSTSLKELQGWGIVRLVHVRGDKRDHFESMKDVWEMFRVVMDERKKREFDPTMKMLQECIEEAHADKATDEYTEERLRELHQFFKPAIKRRRLHEVRIPTKTFVPPADVDRIFRRPPAPAELLERVIFDPRSGK